jgi:hypothetical protein
VARPFHSSFSNYAKGQPLPPLCRSPEGALQGNKIGPKAKGKGKRLTNALLLLRAKTCEQKERNNFNLDSYLKKY